LATSFRLNTARIANGQLKGFVAILITQKERTLSAEHSAQFKRYARSQNGNPS
jgi:hypothetical protein